MLSFVETGEHVRGPAFLSSHRREDVNAAHPSTETAFEASPRAQERIPRDGCVRCFGRLRGAVGWVEGQDHADGPASVRQDVRRPRVPHLAHDTRRMRLQLSNADDLCRRSRTRRTSNVVSHVTTLLARPPLVKDSVHGIQCARGTLRLAFGDS